MSGMPKLEELRLLAHHTDTPWLFANPTLGSLRVLQVYHMDRYPPEMRETIRGMPALVPLQRFGTESEVSAAIVFLLSPAAAFISGACLRIDGAAPNAKRIWPQVGTGGSTPAFDGFHLASKPDVLKD